MSGGLVTAAYIVAAILFIFSLAGLSKHETSKQGNLFGISGMALALLATIFGPDSGNVAWILLAMVIGGAIGVRLAQKVEMTEMPELVAILHSFVGLAAVLVGFNSFIDHGPGLPAVMENIHLTEVFLGIFIGAVTFTGSLVAFGKLRGKISSRPLMLPHRHKLNLLALVGIIFSMQVYDRVIPAQSYPTLYVLYGGVIISVIFTYILRVGRDHVTDLLGKRADMRVSDRVFGHALRLRNSAIPRSTGTFISQLRELEAIREMVTSTTVSSIVDMPFFLLFMLVMAIIAPQLAWIAPVAVILMILPGVLKQKTLARLAHQSLKESTLRNAVLVESVQGLEDIKLMQAEDRFLQQWNSYIRITAQSGVEMRKVMHSLISWGVTVQGLVYASVIVIGAPMVINGDITTGAIVAASLLSSRMIAPMGTLCGVLARWQQVKAAKTSLDALMALPVENSKDETRIHCPVLFGHYQFSEAMFRYYSDSATIALRIKSLTIKPGERVAVLGRNGSGKSTLLQAMIGGMDLVGGELRLDNLSLPHIDLADVRRNVGLMTQNARLFHGTLRENLTMGAAHASDEAIFAALTVSGGADFIRRLPLGLDHPVMEGGVGLSGGQRQSVLLARMLLRDPNIVLLDEPTASLDDHTEKEFIERLGQWLNGRTLVVATHRAAILALVDRVLVLKEGQLVMDSPKESALPPARPALNRPEDQA